MCCMIIKYKILQMCVNIYHLCFTDENVDEDVFIKLNESDLKCLDIKLSNRKRIIRIVNEKKINEYIAATTIIITRSRRCQQESY